MKILYYEDRTPSYLICYSLGAKVKLIHAANAKSRPVGIIVFAHVVRPSVPTFQI